MKKTKKWYINRIKKLMIKQKKLLEEYLETIQDEGNERAKTMQYLSITLFADSMSMNMTNDMCMEDKIDMYWQGKYGEEYEMDYSKEGQ